MQQKSKHPPNWDDWEKWEEWFKQNLKKYRADESQTVFGDGVNVTHGAVASWEKGFNQPTLKKFMMICYYLKKTPNELLLDESFFNQGRASPEEEFREELFAIKMRLKELEVVEKK
jgi:transcriptional regulator with XRE-family HTH domain